MADPRPSARSAAALLWRDKWLLLAALGLLWFVRLFLWVAGYARLNNYFPADNRSPPAPPALAARCAGAIRRAAAFTPRPTCLVQAAAGRMLLALRGHAATIHVGVRRQGAAFEAHAWLVSDGLVILGGSDRSLAAYNPLMQLK